MWIFITIFDWGKVAELAEMIQHMTHQSKTQKDRQNFATNISESLKLSVYAVGGERVVVFQIGDSMITMTQGHWVLLLDLSEKMETQAPNVTALLSHCQ